MSAGCTLALLPAALTCRAPGSAADDAVGAARAAGLRSARDAHVVTVLAVLLVCQRYEGPALGHRVTPVVGAGAEEQVVRVHTGRVVTPVTDEGLRVVQVEAVE